jgi:hypothetical protein
MERISTNIINKGQNKMHRLAKLRDVQSLIKMVNIISLSLLFSFFFSKSSFFSFLHSLNFYLSTFPYQLFTHTIDKNCIFLLCNGLLVFLAKYSGLIKTLSLSNNNNNPQDHDDHQSCYYSKNNHNVYSHHHDDQSHLMSSSSSSPTKEVLVVLETIKDDHHDHEDENVVIKEEVKTILEDHKNEEQESEFPVSNNQKEEEEEETSLVQVQEKEEEFSWSEDEDDEEEEELGNGKLSTEELNKKFDEFIRRMKEELRIEAQQHLIMV